MIKAIEDITITDGVNPRESVIVAGGGAAGLNILAIASSMNCRKVIVPKTAGVLSAAGAQHSDVAIDFSASCHIISHNLDEAKIAGTLELLGSRASALEAELRAKGIQSFKRELFVEARYVGQQWELELAAPEAWQQNISDAGILKRAFDDHHQRLYSVNQPEAPIETMNWRLRLTALLPRPKSVWLDPENAGADSDRWVDAWFAEAGKLKTRVVDGTTLKPGVKIVGPAIIEEPTTTIVVPPGNSGHLTTAGNYLFDIGGSHV
jgi:N-methylhydantoinase A